MLITKNKLIIFKHEYVRLNIYIVILKIDYKIICKLSYILAKWPTLKALKNGRKLN